jgi:hypothetical protein
MKPFMVTELEQEIVRVKTRLEAVIPYLRGELSKLDPADPGEMEGLALRAKLLAEDLYVLVRGSRQGQKVER